MVPERILIVREKGYHTDQIGQYGNGNQLMAFVVATVPRIGESKYRGLQPRWYAVLHTFDRVGSHLDTQTWFAGTTTEGERGAIERAEAKLEEMLKQLGPIRFKDVKIKLFQVEVDGQTFGLVDASEPEAEYESIHLLPNDLAFFEPWDGLYDT